MSYSRVASEVLACCRCGNFVTNCFMSPTVFAECLSCKKNSKTDNFKQKLLYLINISFNKVAEFLVICKNLVWYLPYFMQKLWSSQDSHSSSLSKLLTFPWFFFWAFSNYNTSVAWTLMALLPQLFRTRSWVPKKKSHSFRLGTIYGVLLFYTEKVYCAYS